MSDEDKITNDSANAPSDERRPTNWFWISTALSLVVVIAIWQLGRGDIALILACVSAAPFLRQLGDFFDKDNLGDENERVSFEKRSL